MLVILGIIALTIIALGIAQPLAVVLHEIGHAIPAALFTRSEKIEVYLGSFGNSKKQPDLKIGRVYFYMTYSPLAWTHGLCKFDRPPKHYFLSYLIIAGGPLISVASVVTAVWLPLQFDMNGFFICVVLVWLVMVLSSIHGFVFSKRTVTLNNGSVIYSDMEILKRLWKNRKNKEYFLLGEYESHGAEYNKALIEHMEGLIKGPGISNKNKHRLMLLHYNARNYKRTTELAGMLENSGLLSINDRYLIADSFFRLGDNINLENQYSAMIKAGVRDPAVFNERGYIYLESNSFDQALIDFNAAIAAGRNNAFPYNNRGLVKILKGKPEEGLEDILTSLMLNDKNSYAYRNLGIYYLETGDIGSALDNFEKAYKLDKNTPLLETLLNGTKAKKELSLKG